MVINVMTKYQHCNMLFGNKDKAVINNLYQYKEYGVQRILTEFSKANCER